MKITLRKKVLGSIVVSVITIATVISAISIMNIISRGETRIESFQAMLMSEKKQQIKGYVDMAVKLLEKMSPEEAKRTIKSMRYGENGYLWINDFNNLMIAHPDPRLEGKDQSDLKDPNGVYILREITRLCRDKGQGYVEYMWKIPGQEALKPKISYASAIPGTNWIAGTGIYVDDIDLEIAKERAKIKQEITSSIAEYLVISFVVSLILLAIAYYGVKRYISGPVEAISDALKTLNNDLTLTVPITTTDEIGELASWLNQHVKHLRQVIGMVSEVTVNIHSQAGIIASTIDEQSGFATELSSSVVEISSTMEEFSSTASQIARHSQGVVERADKTLEDTKRGAREVETLTLKINDISNDLQGNLAEIVALGRKSKEITKIMEIINNIANQTKLIAFNAALEAASAGESGKRFGVVAVEIRRLADSVVESTSEIEGKITEILDTLNRLVMSSEKSSILIDDGQQYATHTLEMLIDIVESVEETTSAARQISLSTQQQQIASSQVLLALRDIEQGTHHSSDSVRTINAVTNEFSVMSEKLTSLVTLFKVKEGKEVPKSGSPGEGA